MNEFKYLNPTVFEHHLKLYELISTSIQKEIASLESKKLTAEETSSEVLYKRSLDILVENTFLQIYATLEESLYYECEPHIIKKNASILRFEHALGEQGYDIDNEYWIALIETAKIRNCLLHGNGRLDVDKYGIDTRNTINSLNCATNMLLIEVIDLKKTSKLKLNTAFLYYYISTIKNFINS